MHLRVHSHYSLLQSSIFIDDLVKAAKADGQKALALTDFGNLFGAIEFFKECKKAGIQPILGMAAYVAGRTRLEKSAGGDNPTYQLTLLAENNRGFENLKRLSTRGHVEGFYYRPRIDKEILAEHAEGLIVLSGPLQSEITSKLLQGDRSGAKAAALAMLALLGEGRFFLEITRSEGEQHRKASELLVELAKETGIPLVATNDAHYLKREDVVAHEILLCISNGSVISDDSRYRMPSRELWLKSRAEMERSFGDLPEALANTVSLAARCKVEFDFRSYHLPTFPPPEGETAPQLFARLCKDGLASRYGDVTPDLQKRLDYEIGVITKLGFVTYFLVVWDFIRYAKDHGIAVGPGRGSAAGSLVAYCLGITDVDPIRYHLIFERFLNPERVSMPDIDIDFCAARREEVIEYVRRKYGDSNVSQIVTFGTLASRGVVRDVGRVMEIPLEQVDSIAKKVPQGPGASLKKALEDPNSELLEVQRSDPKLKSLFDVALKLEGLARHTSTHAAGVVIADKPLVDYVPMCRNSDVITTQWQMTELEEVGLLKMDFLGLKTLDILEETVRLVKQTRSVDLDLDALPLDDKPTFELMTRGETLGVFQLESSGMRELLHELKPDKFEDVIAVLALYRPGPIGSGMVKMFWKRKHGEEPIEYPHSSVAHVLEDTYGVIVYQEQVMLIANVLAGFTLAEADSLRKAMSKKQPEAMAKYKDKFVDGAERNGHDRKFSADLFATIEYFAGYGFNKSHSTAYALLTYRTAWLKAHHPVEFLAANMTIESGDTDKLKEYVDESRRQGVGILPPDVNKSLARFGVEDGAIRYGLQAIKGLGTRAAEAMAEERAKSGAFRSVDDFCIRLDHTLLNKGSLEAMAKAGAFDTLGATRKATFDELDRTLRGSASARKDRARGQRSLFGEIAPPPRTNPEGGDEWTERDKLIKEKEALGFFLSSHPFERRGRFYGRIAGTDSRQLRLEKPGAGTSVRLAGMISSTRILVIKQGRNAGQKMARFQLEDLDGIVPVTVFARQFQDLSGLLVDDTLVFVRGRIDASNEELGLLADEIQPAQVVVNREVYSLVVKLEAARADEATLEKLRKICARHRGEQRLEFEIQDGGWLWRLRADGIHHVAIGDDLLDALADLLGPESLSFTR